MALGLGVSSAFQKTISILGCGWLGLPLAVSLVSQDYKIKGSTTRVDKLDQLEKAGIEPYLLKVTDKLEGDFQDLFETDVLVINIPPGRREQDVVKSYPLRTKLILDQFRIPESIHVIFISSTGVYQSTGGVVDESLSCHPERDSGKAILKAESIIMELSHSFTILRMAGLVGGERQPGRWFEGKTDIPGGDTPVNMIHQADCIRAITSVISLPATGDIYNLCADEHPVKKVFYATQSQKLSLASPVFLEGTIPHKIVDNAKFKERYNFSYQYPDPKKF